MDIKNRRAGPLAEVVRDGWYGFGRELSIRPRADF